MEEKIRVTPTLLEINTRFKDYLKICGKHEDKINKDNNLKYIIAYGNILISYGEEIALLYNHNWNNAIPSLTRSFLECYSIVKSLIHYHNNTREFEEYVRYLFYVDIKQTLYIIDEYEKEKSKVEKGNLREEFIQNEIKANLDNIKWIIKNFFNEYEITDNGGNNIKEICNKIDEIYKKSKFNNSITYNVSRALYNNKDWVRENSEKYLGSKAVYGILCSSSHNNISSMYKRTIQNKNLSINVESDDIEPSLNIVSSCMQDINDEFKNNILK